MVEKIRKAAHCVNRGDLDSDIIEKGGCGKGSMEVE